MPEPILNIAAYRFTPLTALVPLRNELRRLAQSRQLRGSILLSPEGINLFIAGRPQDVAVLLEFLRQVPGLGDLQAKESFSRERPFRRMLVKIKREIIPFGVDGIDPTRSPARRIAPRQLKQWLDEGRPLVLLDTRNEFEVRVGTFRNAVSVGLRDFRDFPAAAAALPAAYRNQTLVTFCTGGIRCEKAAPWLEQHGFADVYQLDGGILKWFEECGGDYFEGECFVFDRRVALDPALRETATTQCFVCQVPLSPEDQASPLYAVGVSCPHCFPSQESRRSALLRERQLSLQRIATPLPGSLPYENRRAVRVPQRSEGLQLLDFLESLHTSVSRDEWLAACQAQRLTCDGRPVTTEHVVRAGQRVVHVMPETREPDVNAEIRILYEDEALVVVHKPAPIPVHPCGRFNRNTVSYLLDQVFQPLHLKPAHRLDVDTTGVMVFTKSRAAARLVQPQFEAGQVHKEYVARVLGHPAQDEFEIRTALRGKKGARGVRLPDPQGLAAATCCRVLRRCENGTTLLALQPQTGRTNQIRVHLWDAGLPIVGDPLYLPQRNLGEAPSLAVGDPPMCLHAAAIAFRHPLSRQMVRFEAELPQWASAP